MHIYQLTDPTTKWNAMQWNPKLLTVLALLSFFFPLWNAEPFWALDLLRKIMQSSWCHHNNVRRLEKHMRHWKWLKHQAEKMRRDRLEERTNTVNEKKTTFGWIIAIRLKMQPRKNICAYVAFYSIFTYSSLECCMHVLACDVKWKRFTGIIRGRKWNWTAAKLSN